MAHLQEEADKRNVKWKPKTGQTWAAATHWLTRVFATTGPKLSCEACHIVSRDCLICMECDAAMCRTCLQVGKEELFNIGFTCVACAVTSLPYQWGMATASPQLKTLHDARMRTLGARLKPGTWRKYQRWIADIQNFMLSTTLVIFPILCEARANAFTYFLEHLKSKGYSWGHIRSCRSAVHACQRSLPGITPEFADPFARFPILEMMSAGVQRSVNNVVRQRKPMPGKIVVALVRRLHQIYNEGRMATPREARTALRNAVIWASGFYGIRRSAELFCNANRSMGLLVKDVTIVKGKRIEFFIRSMKNDTFAAGHTISLNWVTASGVELGELFTAYLVQLREDGIGSDSPFFAPTSRAGIFVPVEPGKTSKFNHVVKQLLREFFPHLTTVQLADYSFHSLRRGGATWARSRGVPLGLILAQGLWNTVDGARSYLVPSLEEITLATSLM